MIRNHTFYKKFCAEFIPCRTKEKAKGWCFKCKSWSAEFASSQALAANLFVGRGRNLPGANTV
jgi:hypothetical protein